MKINKYLVLYGINFSPEITGIGKYTKDMSDWLSSNDVNQIVVTSFPYYPAWEIQKPYKGYWYKKEIHKNGKLIVYRCPLYVPKKPNGIGRIFHEFTFLLSSAILLVYLSTKGNFSKILCISPPFHLGLNAIIIQFFFKIPFDYHIQDLQVQAANKLKMINSNLLIRSMESLQKYIYNKADKISTISESMEAEIQKGTKKDIIQFPNWVDCEKFHPRANYDYLKRKYNIPIESKILLYSGSIGQKQGLGLILDIASEFSSNSKLTFIITGIGPYFEELRKKAELMKINSIHFLSPIPELEYNDFLNMATIHYIPTKKGTSNFFMPSKLGPILAVGGLALVCTESGTELHKLITSNKMGLVAESENKNSIINQIHYCLQNDCSNFKANARKFAITKLERQIVLETYFYSKDK